MKEKVFQIALLIVLLLTPSLWLASQVSPRARLSQQGREAYQTLLVADRFEGKELGWGRAPSTLLKAYKTLLKEPAADMAFKSLLNNATVAGQLYALCGLFFTDRKAFHSSIGKFRHTSQEVYTLFGCIGGPRPVSDLVEASKPIVIDPSRPEESLREYFELNTKIQTEWNEWYEKGRKNGKDQPPAEYQLDILNGGYPVWFRYDE